MIGCIVKIVDQIDTELCVRLTTSDERDGVCLRLCRIGSWLPGPFHTPRLHKMTNKTETDDPFSAVFLAKSEPFSLVALYCPATALLALSNASGRLAHCVASEFKHWLRNAPAVQPEATRMLAFAAGIGPASTAKGDASWRAFRVLFDRYIAGDALDDAKKDQFLVPQDGNPAMSTRACLPRRLFSSHRSHRPSAPTLLHTRGRCSIGPYAPRTRNPTSGLLELPANPPSAGCSIGCGSSSGGFQGRFRPTAY